MAVCWQIVYSKQISDMICHHCIGPYIHSANYNPPSMLFMFTQSFYSLSMPSFTVRKKYIFTVEKLMCCSCEHFWKQLSQLFVLICSSVHPLDPFSHLFLLLSFSWRLRILTGYAQGKWEHSIHKCRRLLNFFCPVSEHCSNSIKSSYVGQTPIQLVKVP